MGGFEKKEEIRKKKSERRKTEERRKKRRILLGRLGKSSLLRSNFNLPTLMGSGTRRVGF